MKLSVRAAALCAALLWLRPASPEPVLLDTDIGDDIDDTFALSLLLRSPEVKLLGITTTYGDTRLRARLVDRYLAAVGRAEIPVAVGVPTQAASSFTQAVYARRQAERKHPDGVAFLLDQVRKDPGKITLIAIGPLGNIRAAIERDRATFRKLRRVVLMSGSIYRGYGPPGTPPAVEWNARQDPDGLKTLLASGVPVYMLPLDSTQIALSADQQDRIFSAGTALTDQITLLYHQWKARSGWHPTGPNLFDPVAVTYAIKPEICTAEALRIEVDGRGMTKPADGAPNAKVCMAVDEKAFVELLLDRIAPISPDPHR
jgi:inosine-uridine nucleoside N-ribohydrolase